MLFQPPQLEAVDHAVLALVEEHQESVRYQISETRRWLGTLRRTALAHNIRGSNSIEGYHVSLEDAFAAVEGDEPADAQESDWRAVQGYRNAMTYVLQLAEDSDLPVDETLLRSLHFMMIQHDLSKRPGRYRRGDIFVRDDDRDETVYEGPPAEDVPGLMAELVLSVRQQAEADEQVLITAAMAHLNLTMIHPFRDGNGRMARALQSLVLIRGRVAAAPEFSSIEEYLGANEQPYYDVLSEMGAGAWHPERDALPWIRFNLTAHYRQTLTVLRRVREAQRFWLVAEREVERARLPERCLDPLSYCLSGRVLRNSTYRSVADVNEAIAGRDLKALVAADILQPRGEKRGRVYLPIDRLLEEHQQIQRAVRRQVQVEADPYEIVRQSAAS